MKTGAAVAAFVLLGVLAEIVCLYIGGLIPWGN